MAGMVEGRLRTNSVLDTVGFLVASIWLWAWGAPSSWVGLRSGQRFSQLSTSSARAEVSTLPRTWQCVPSLPCLFRSEKNACRGPRMRRWGVDGGGVWEETSLRRRRSGRLWGWPAPSPATGPLPPPWLVAYDHGMRRQPPRTVRPSSWHALVLIAAVLLAVVMAASCNSGSETPGSNGAGNSANTGGHSAGGSGAGGLLFGGQGRAEETRNRA